MTNHDETARWSKAGELARIAMGKVSQPDPLDLRRSINVDVATLDPLAWWCLTEAIYDL